MGVNPYVGSFLATFPMKEPIGQEWADRYPERFNQPDTRVPDACFICGHPTGSCTGDAHEFTNTPAVTEK